MQEEIDKLEREYSDLEEIWKSEKAAVQGSHHIKEELEQGPQELETAQRAGDLARAGLSCSTGVFRSWKNSWIWPRRRKCRK